MPNTELILSELKSLDLKSYPINDIYTQLSLIEKLGSVLVTFHPGKPIFRARLNQNGERFTSPNQLSYKPAYLNLKYQRASIPHRTMFYGSTISENLQEGELDNSRVIVTFEAVPWMRDKSATGCKKITYTKWIANQDINLIAVIGKKEFYEKNSFLKELGSGFVDYLKAFPDIADDMIMVNTFLANEFAKEDTKDDFNYLISAIFADIMVQKGFDGVVYPSTRMEGQGFNLALTPEAADNKLDFILAGECSIFKKEDQMVIDNDFNGFLEGGTIIYQKITDPKQHAGIENCLKVIGVHSIEELNQS